MQEHRGERRRNALVAAFGLVLAATALAAWMGWPALLGWGTGTLVVLAAAIGAIRDGRLGILGWYLAAAELAYLLLFWLMLRLPADTGHLVGGLPPATAAAIYGLWLVGLLLVTLPYALHFGSAVLDQRTLERIARLGRESQP